MLVTLFGIKILFKLMQSQKASASISVMLLEIVMFIKLMHPSNVFSLITVTLSGIIIFVKLTQALNAEFPMFIAEDVDMYFPLAVDHNTDGLPENWNERIMIPAMFVMIKSQKSEIDLLKQELNEIKQLLRKE